MLTCSASFFLFFFLYIQKKSFIQRILWHCDMTPLKADGREKKQMIERLLLNHAKTPGFLTLGGEEFNPGPETRLDRSELLCNKVLLKYKGDRESFWHRHQKGAERVPLPAFFKAHCTSLLLSTLNCQGCWRSAAAVTCCNHCRGRGQVPICSWPHTFWGCGPWCPARTSWKWPSPVPWIQCCLGTTTLPSSCVPPINVPRPWCRSAFLESSVGWQQSCSIFRGPGAQPGFPLQKVVWQNQTVKFSNWGAKCPSCLA